MNEQQFIEANPFNSHLFHFLVENQDCFLQGKVDKTMEVITVAYQLCGGIVCSQAPTTQILAYIKYVDSIYQDSSSLILAIAWATLSVYKTKSHSYKSITSILYSKLSSLKCFSLWKHFVSAYLQGYGPVEIQLPEDSIIEISDATTGEEAMEHALQSAVASHSGTVRDIHQTLVFPHVEQFNNNPAKVINNNQKK